jgi:hypothetical protein
MTSREDLILKPRDPSVEDENEWEEFSLTDVKVLIPGKSRYANLLDASPDNPVRVVGSLNEVEDEQGHLGIAFLSFCCSIEITFPRGRALDYNNGLTFTPQTFIIITHPRPS